MSIPFSEKPASERRLDIQKMFQKYPDKIPIFIEKNKFIPELIQQKYLVPRELTVGQFLYIIRKRIMLPSDKALFIFFNNQLVNTQSTIMEVYETHHNKEDTMLYATCSLESTFG